MFDPVYGELITSRQVAEMTGFTMNQLRNYRMPNRLEKAPFPFVRIGGTTLYRKADIELWLQDNEGTIRVEYVTAEGQKTAPLANTPEVQDKRLAFAQLGRITTANSFDSMATWAIEQSGLDNGTQIIHDEGRRLLALERGLSDWKTLPIPTIKLKATDLEAFWKIWTYGVRKVMAMVNSFDVTDQDIISIPVGDVPPLKTK